MDNTKLDYSNTPTVRKKSKLPIIIIVVLLTVALSGGIFLFSRNKSSKLAEVTESGIVTPTHSPIPTPTVVKESIKIQVLNGTGTPGQAVKVATTLKNVGYNPDNIKTGNSTNNLGISSISSKVGFESIAEDMKTVLSSDLPDIEITTSPLETDNEFDIVIMTGGKKYEAPKPSPTFTGKATPSSTPTGTTGTPRPTTATPTSTPTLIPTPSP